MAKDVRLSTFYVGADRRGLVVVDQNVSGNTDRNLNPTWRQHPPHTRYDLTIAHGQGVVHRDIKPSNVLLDGYGKIKLADFGIASIASASGDPQLTSLTMQLGTPDYIAPEQRVNVSNVDQRADVYSLGVMLYEMLCGELPLGAFPNPS